MLSYQHGFHAGNRADVLKHAILHGVLAHLKQNSAPLLYVETHAARGRYDLTGKQARKTGEARDGILALLNDKSLPKALENWVGEVRAKGVTAYPGSPVLASDALSATDRLVLFEKHPGEHANLLAVLGGQTNIQIFHEDGYRGALRLQPRRQEEMLLLLDPSYETEADMEALTHWVPRALRKWPKAKILIWLPLFADRREEDFGAYLASLDKGFVAGSRWPQHEDTTSSLEGSAMIGLRLGGASARKAFSIAAALDTYWQRA